MADALGTPGPPAGPGVVSALDHRLDQAGLIAPQGAGMAVRTGVLAGPGTTTLVTGTSATGTMTYAIAAHHWVSTRGTADGVYLGATEAAQTVPTTAAPGANSRIDVIWEKQQDQYSTVSPDTTSAPQYGVTQGTAAASPTKPTIPVGALELATAVVAAGATSTNGAGVTITNTVPQTVARGAPIPVNSQAERDALTAFDSRSVKRLDLGGVEQQRISGAWKTVVTTEPTRGLATLTTDAAGLCYINHGMGVTPTHAQCTLAANSDAVDSLAALTLGALTSTQIQLVMFRMDTHARLNGATFKVYWLAYP